MRKIYIFILCLFCTAAYAQSNKFSKPNEKFVLVIHGGAGNMSREMSVEKQQAYTNSLKTALAVGYNMLLRGSTALDVVEKVVTILENDSLFNAGKGAVFTHEGKNELDAAIMDGKTLNAGSVAGVTTIKNPVKAARAVMEKTKHVMLAGKGAEQFATENGLDIVDPSYFYTKERWDAYQKARAQDSVDDLRKKKSFLKQPRNYDYKYGTVGAVALDKNGNLAAATSTGGMTNKKFGRIGDCPIIGAGTYADNNTCAISCTGWGEFFIRLSMAKSVSDRMELKGMSLQDAANEMIQQKLETLGGDGGLIGVDKQGNLVMEFNTTGMFRGFIASDGKEEIHIFKD